MATYQPPAYDVEGRLINQRQAPNVIYDPLTGFRFGEPAPATESYNPFLNPGSAAQIFGQKPGALPLPNPQADLAAVTPQYGDLTALLSQNILKGLRGGFPTDLERNQSNARAVAGGYGGSEFGRRAADWSVQKAKQDQRNTATGQLLQSLGVMKSTATLDPETQALINKLNLSTAAAPDPAVRGQFDIALQRDAQARSANPLASTGSTGGRGGAAVPQLQSYSPIARSAPDSASGSFTGYRNAAAPFSSYGSLPGASADNPIARQGYVNPLEPGNQLFDQGLATGPIQTTQPSYVDDASQPMNMFRSSLFGGPSQDESPHSILANLGIDESLYFS